MIGMEPENIEMENFDRLLAKYQMTQIHQYFPHR